MKTFIKNFVGEILLTGGVGLFVYNIFNFSSAGGRGGEWIAGDVDFSQIFSGPGRYEFEYVYYYYTLETLLMIAVGAILITLGILIMRNKNNRPL